MLLVPGIDMFSVDILLFCLLRNVWRWQRGKK